MRAPGFIWFRHAFLEYRVEVFLALNRKLAMALSISRSHERSLDEREMRVLRLLSLKNSKKGSQLILLSLHRSLIVKPLHSTFDNFLKGQLVDSCLPTRTDLR